MGRIWPSEGIKEYFKCGKEMEGNYEYCTWEGNGKEIMVFF